jgi:hypothetical protein
MAFWHGKKDYGDMHKQALYALAHPVFDPVEITGANFWLPTPRASACLTVNIGLE